MSSLVFALISALIISLLSLIGLAFIGVKAANLNRFTVVMVSFAVGTLLGDAFIHLLPQAFSDIPSSLLASLLAVGGILLFFFMEKILRWHHCHDPGCEDSVHHIVAINLVGDTVHNFIDGLLIAGSFQVSTKLGLATTLAVLVHEIPQEISDFGIFLHHGLSLKTALKYNFISALSSFVGVLLAYILGSGITGLSIYILPVTAGGFIYLAASDLIPELHTHHPSLISTSVQTTSIILGVTLMTLLLLLE